MPATPSRIGFVTEAFRRATSETASASTRHGNLARESADPIDTYFGSVADAQVRADERQALLSADRRLFEIKVAGGDVERLLDYLESGVVQPVRFIDDERGVDMSAMMTELVFDFDEQACTLKVWG